MMLCVTWGILTLAAVNPPHHQQYCKALSRMAVFNVLKKVFFFYLCSRYRIQYESLLQVEKEQNEFIEDFGIK